MLHPATRKLLERLHERTLDGAPLWRRDGGAIVVDASGYQVRLAVEEPAYALNDDQGRPLEAAGTEALSSARADDGRTYAELVRETVTLALRHISGVDEAIDRFLSGIETPEPPPTAAGLAAAVAATTVIGAVSVPEAVTEPEPDAEPEAEAAPVPPPHPEPEPPGPAQVHAGGDWAESQPITLSAPEAKPEPAPDPARIVAGGVWAEGAMIALPAPPEPEAIAPDAVLKAQPEPEPAPEPPSEPTIMAATAPEFAEDPPYDPDKGVRAKVFAYSPWGSASS